ncbi:MAG: translation initiation factor IF-3 [Elusimicrobiaceae bacterium]
MREFPTQNKTDRPPRRNFQIRISPVRVIDEKGEMLGILSVEDAISTAQDRGLDLVEIVPQAKPPVCKIMNYSKFLYEQDKKKREARRKQKSGVIKEIKMRPNIAAHDLETKLKHLEEIIQKYDRVRLTLEFRGRENQHKDIGHKLITDLIARYQDIATTDTGIQSLGNKMSVVFSSKIKPEG